MNCRQYFAQIFVQLCASHFPHKTTPIQWWRTGRIHSWPPRRPQQDDQYGCFLILFNSPHYSLTFNVSHLCMNLTWLLENAQPVWISLRCLCPCPNAFSVYEYKINHRDNRWNSNGATCAEPVTYIVATTETMQIGWMQRGGAERTRPEHELFGVCL